MKITMLKRENNINAQANLCFTFNSNVRRKSAAIACLYIYLCINHMLDVLMYTDMHTLVHSILYTNTDKKKTKTTHKIYTYKLKHNYNEGYWNCSKASVIDVLRLDTRVRWSRTVLPKVINLKCSEFKNKNNIHKICFSF